MGFLSLSSSEILEIEQKVHKSSIPLDKVPYHVAIIADGNRRWAAQNGKKVSEGHSEGAENVLRLAERAYELGVTVLTVWVMDTKNYQKRKDEVKHLIKLLLSFLLRFKKEFLNRNFRFSHIGARHILPKRVQKLLSELEESTKKKDGCVVNIAFNYGGRDDIVRAVKSLVRDGYKEEEINEDLISNYIDASQFGDPDMIIRTGKEQRLSGFMTWQSAPSELFFSNIYFPDFRGDDFEKLVKEYGKRNRTLGA